jgi:hypothetical protein
MFTRWVLLAGLLILLSGCAGGIAVAPKPLVVRASPAPPVVTATPTGEREGEAAIILMGTVMDVSMSARIIRLERAVQGFQVIALTEDTELVSSGGDPVTLRDIRPGMTVQATGRPGDSKALIAEEVLVALPRSTPTTQGATPAVPTAGSDSPEDADPGARDVERIQFADGVTQTTVAGSLPRSMKGYELYSWSTPAEHGWTYALITGTNRDKSYGELSSPENLTTADGWVKITVHGRPALKAVLDRLPEGESVIWLDVRRVTGAPAGVDAYPDEAVVEEIVAYAAQRGVRMSILN